MRIAGLEIEKFGIWERLSLPKLSRGLNIFYGPNEAGKTTLMQFIRSSLYGCANDDRSRYIQMVINDENKDKSSFLPEEGKQDPKVDPASDIWIGGALAVSTEYGQYRLDRRYLRRNSAVYNKQTALEQKSGFVLNNGLAGWSGRFYPIAGKGIAESLIVTGPDGTRLSDYFVQTLVNNVDEATFNNVFAIGLDELQKLGTLSETDAAQMLYRLSVGVDRVSLIQVLHQIVDERNEIFDIQGKSAILESLLARKNRLAQKSSEAVFHLNEYNRILGEQREVLEAVARLKEKIDKLHHQQRLYEIALAVAPVWDSRNKIRSEISALGDVLAIEESALTESDKYQKALLETSKTLAGYRADYLALKQELEDIQIPPVYLEMAPRIEWLTEEIPHLAEIQKKRTLLISEKNEIARQLNQEELRLRGSKNGKIYLTRNAVDTLQEKKSDDDISPSEQAVAEKNTVLWSDTDLREVEDYRIPARAVHRAGIKYRKTKEQLQLTQKRLAQVAEKLESGLTSRGQRNLSEALENTNELSAALKRRIELSKRLGEMNTYRKELERVNANLVANQSLQTLPLLMIGAGIVLGGLLIGMAFFRKDPGLGILGALLGTVCFAVKGSIEHRNFARLQENQRQLGLLVKQIEQVKNEAQVIDTRFPAPAQSLEVRLQKAQSDLSLFEKLSPLDTQWKEINQHVQTLENRIVKSREILTGALKRWRRWLKIAGLPLTLKPIQIKEMLERVDIAEDLRRRVDAINSELEFLDREQRGIEDHLARVVAETGFKYPETFTREEIILGLSQELKEVRALVEKQEDLNKRRILCLRQRRKTVGELHRQKKEQRDYLMIFNVKDPQELVNLRKRWLDFKAKREQLELLEMQLEEGIGRFCEEKTISDLLDIPEVRADLLEDQVKLEDRIENLTTEHQEKLELSGRLGEQLNVLANKKDSIRQQFDRNALDVRIGEVSTLWQSRAVACRMMEDIRKAYERERQPETLREASAFLRKLTGGQYVKIWTPLGENILYVDTDQGKTLDVSDLSRGTREQLFIAIRLALTLTFEKHGVQLPLILDDVLVNFDNQRAKAAAKLLHSFAKSGHQILLFTCHDHICKIFLGLDTPVHVLPAFDEKNKKFKVLLPPSKTAEPVPVKKESVIPEPVQKKLPDRPAPSPVSSVQVIETKTGTEEKPIVIDTVPVFAKSSKVLVSVHHKSDKPEPIENTANVGSVNVAHIVSKKGSLSNLEKHLNSKKYIAVNNDPSGSVPKPVSAPFGFENGSVPDSQQNINSKNLKTSAAIAPEVKKIDTRVVDQTREVLNRFYSSDNNVFSVDAVSTLDADREEDNELLNNSEENDSKREETEHIDVNEILSDLDHDAVHQYSPSQYHVVSDSDLLSDEEKNGADIPVMKLNEKHIRFSDSDKKKVRISNENTSSKNEFLQTYFSENDADYSDESKHSFSLKTNQYDLYKNTPVENDPTDNILSLEENEEDLSASSIDIFPRAKADSFNDESAKNNSEPEILKISDESEEDPLKQSENDFADDSEENTPEKTETEESQNDFIDDDSDDDDYTDVDSDDPDSEDDYDDEDSEEEEDEYEDEDSEGEYDDEDSEEEDDEYNDEEEDSEEDDEFDYDDADDLDADKE